MAIGASTVLLEKASPPLLLDAAARFGATVMFTAPTSYRAMAEHGEALRATALRKCVSAGEALPAATRALWKDATGIELIDGIGATELLHIFISHDEAHARPGATGTPLAAATRRPPGLSPPSAALVGIFGIPPFGEAPFFWALTGVAI